MRYIMCNLSGSMQSAQVKVAACLLTLLLGTSAYGRLGTRIGPTVANHTNEAAVVVRIYNDWPHDPSKFRRIECHAQGSAFTVPADKLGEFTLLAVVSDDQTDPLIRQMIGDSAVVTYEVDDKQRRTGVVQFHLSRGNAGTLRAVNDALGQPIIGAKVTVFAVDNTHNTRIRIQIAQATTDAKGRFPLPSVRGKLRGVTVKIEHEDYGIALTRHSSHRANQPVVSLLIAGSSKAAARAIDGQVVDADGTPLDGVEIKVTHVRTPGEGLVNNPFASETVAITGDQGRFRVYCPDEDPRNERGDLIPKDSRYSLALRYPRDLTYFPLRVMLKNDKPVKIVLKQGKRYHKIVLQGIDRRPITDHDLLKRVRISYFEKDRMTSVLLPS